MNPGEDLLKVQFGDVGAQLNIAKRNTFQSPAISADLSRTVGERQGRVYDLSVFCIPLATTVL